MTFYTLTLYSATLLQSFISFRIFYIDDLSSVKKKSQFFLPSQYNLISFSCLIPLATTSNMMLKRSGEIERSCLVSTFMEKLLVSFLTIKYDVSCRFSCRFLKD